MMATKEELKKGNIEGFVNYLTHLPQTKELWLDLGDIGNSYLSFGEIYVFENNIVAAKKEYCKAAKLAIEYYDIYRSNRYPNLIRHKQPIFAYAGTMMAAILCDDELILKEYAETIAYEGHPAMRYEVMTNITHALKYLLLNDFEKSKEYVELIHLSKHFQSHFRGFSHIVKGILENDVELVNEGILHRIKYYKRHNPKGSAYCECSVQATALAKLAMLYGLKPNVDSAFIHKGLLAKTEGIEYEGIEEILNALEEANFKAGK
jgi:hypothetical protein